VRANTIGGGPMAVTADVRFTLDGTPITAWISSTAGVWRAACDWRTVSPGSHWLSCEDLLGQHVAEGIEVTVDNGGGPVVGEQDIWTGPTNYALRNNVCSVGGVKVRYTPGVGPRPDPLIPRAGTPYATRLPTSSLWVERMAMAVPKDSLARFTDTPGGYVCVKPRQVYAWFDKAGSIVPGFKDGSRNVGNIGYVWQAVVDRRDNSFVGCNVGGRILRVDLSGHVTTVLGRRLKADRLMPYHDTVDSDWWAKYSAWHEAHYEQVGMWLDGPAGLNKPWSVIQCPRWGDDWYGGDTLNHRVFYAIEDPADRTRPWTARTYAGSRTKEAGHRDGPRHLALFNQPWGVVMKTVHPEYRDGLSCDLYVTDRENNSLRKINAQDGAEGEGPVETVVKSIVNPTNAELGVRADDDVSSTQEAGPAALAALRAKYLKDGPFGVCSYVRPEAIDWADEDKTALITVERYTFAIRKTDLMAGTVKTLATVKADANTRNPGLAVDVHGVVGPKGDIFVAFWGQQQNYRFSATGEYKGAFFPEGLAWQDRQLTNGPLDKLMAVPYLSAVAIGNDGSIWGNCTGAEALFRVTKRQPSDIVPNMPLYLRGHGLWHFGSRPAIYSLRGAACQDQLGGPVAAELAVLSDVEFSALAANGFGTGTDMGADVPALREYLRHCSVGSAIGTPAPPPPPPPPVEPPDVDIVTRPGLRIRVNGVVV